MMIALHVIWMVGVGAWISLCLAGVPSYLDGAI